MRCLLALSLLLMFFQGRGQAPPPPETAFHSLIGILQMPDLRKWYELHPADPEPIYRAGLRGGGLVRDFKAQNPEDAPRVASLYRLYLLKQLLNNLWSVFSRARDLHELSLTELKWDAAQPSRDTAYYVYKGHGLLRHDSGTAVYIVVGIFNVAPNGQMLRASIEGVVPGDNMVAYKRWQDSVRNAPLLAPIGGPTAEEMAALGKEEILTYRGVCDRDSILLTERYLRHPSGVRYLQTTRYVSSGSSHQLFQPNGEYSSLGYYGYQLDDSVANRHWCLLRKGNSIIGFIVSDNYLPLCTVQLREVAQ